MKNKLKALREHKNLTQNELAEKSGLSLRTIQRIEAGGVFKGHTLKTIAQILEIDTQDLFFTENGRLNIERAKLINLSVLSGLIIPFGGIAIPLYLTFLTKDEKNKQLGKNIVSIQIILAAVLSVLLIASPFIQKTLSIKFPLFIIFLIAFICLKIGVTIINGISLNKTDDIYNKLKINLI
ncbi:helix-turn-helix domain-containing protein [Flavobacterium sp. H122]|uniref:helix-turn-helix domain-containing protein n=1 Tax=Flavobacterium sp. H122 TaxID=2529860 RepID=UPI0010A99E9D|nr:helix-turn-helix domain-containing protein [Flavobacterium sp. H122]